MPLPDDIAVWKCLDCNAANDETNPTRCWKCNKKKPKLSTVKRILKKRANEAQAKKEQDKAETIAKIEGKEEEAKTDLLFDITKVIK